MKTQRTSKAPAALKVTAFPPAPPEVGLPQYLGLSEAQFKRFYSACHATLDTISADLPGSHSRKAIVEVVLDGGYIDMYGEHSFRTKEGVVPWKEFYSKTLSPWISKHYGTPKFNKLMATVFKFSRYDF